MLLKTLEKGFKVSCGKVFADHPDVLGFDIGKVRQGEDVRHVSETTYCEGVLGRKIGKYFLGEVAEGNSNLLEGSQNFGRGSAEKDTDCSFTKAVKKIAHRGHVHQISGDMSR